MAILLLLAPGRADADTGQAWSVRGPLRTAAVAGAVVGLELRYACYDGRVAAGGGVCCWPGQATDERGRCLGEPRCPAGTRALGLTCLGEARRAELLATEPACSRRAPEGCVEPCSDGDAVACRRLGLAYRDGAVEGQDGVLIGNDLLLRACWLGDAKACGQASLPDGAGDAGQADLARAGRISLQWFTGGLAGGLGALVGVLAQASAEPGDSDTTALVVGGLTGGLLLTASVWGIGEGLGGDGSFWWTLLGAGATTGTAMLLTFSNDDDVSNPFIWTIFVLPPIGAIIGYEVSSALAEADRAADPGLSATVAPLVGPRLQGIGITGHF